MNKIEQAIGYNTASLSRKFDDVEVGTVLEEDNTEMTQLTFYADGLEAKKIKFTGGSGTSSGQGGKLSTTLPESSTIKEKETVILPYSFTSPNYGDATLYITVVNGATSKDLEYPIKKQGAGSVNIGTLTKGINRISMYVVDALSKMSNIVEITIICGALEISSTFDDSLDYHVYNNISIPFNVSALDASETMTLKTDINGTTYTQQVYNGYNSFSFPDDLKSVGVYKVSMQVVTDNFQSNILNYNIIIADGSSILVSSTFDTHSIEEGYLVNVPYRVSNTTQNMFQVKYYINGIIYKEEQINLGENMFSGDYRDFATGRYSLTIEVSTIDGSIKGSLELTLIILPSTFKRITHATVGLEAYFNMRNKSNNSVDKEYLLSEVKSSKGTTAKLVLHNYNFSTNGWIDGRLVSNGGAWAEMVDYLPLEDNVTGGFTFDILFNNNNMGDNSARVIDCTDTSSPYKGFYIDSEKAGLTTEANNLKTFYTDRTDIRVTFVVHRTSTYYEEYIKDENGNSVLNPNPTYKPNPMVQIFIDGIFTEVAMLGDQGSGLSKVYESIQTSSNLLINTNRDHTIFGSNSIKSIRIYNRPLDHEEVLQNYIADYDDLMDQKAIYDKNYVTVDQDLPTLNFYDTDIGKCDLMTKDTKQWIKLVYTSPNKDLFGDSFELMGQCQWQGTSSLAYPTKNYKFKLYDWARNADGDIIEESMNNTDTYKKVKLNMYPADKNGYPENVFCLKADYMDSSHCRNTGTARLVNDFLFDGYNNPAKQIDPLTRDTINGFPCNLYINGKWMGVFNFNHDKACTKTLGLETIPDTVRWEIKANSDTSAGAFFKTWTNIEECYEAILADFEIVYDEDAFVDKTGEYDVTKYYDELGFEHNGPVIGSYYDYAILSLARFVNFVATADEETWKANSDNYFNRVQACRYYLNTMTLGLIDNFAKNCIINMYGDDIWWFSFYDLDSSLGLDNTGYNKFESNIEPSQPGIYNCSTSNMWVKLNDWNQDDLFNQFNIIREGKYTYENICKYLIEKQIDVIPQILYNKDMYTKYISQGRQYLHMLHGNNKDHLKRWLYNRFQYVDSLFLQHNSPYTKQNITIRSCKPANAVPKYDEDGNIISQYTARFEIQTYCPQYVTVCWRKNTFETKRIDFGETVVFECDMVNSQDNELIIYCATNLKSLGDCSNLNPTSVDIGNANRLTEFIVEGSDKLVKADISKNAYLKKVSFKDCTVLGTASGGSNIVDVSTCTSLKEIDLRGTQVTSLLTSVAGGNLEVILYPETIQSIVVSNQANLRVLGIPYGEGLSADNLNTLQIADCRSLKSLRYPYDENNPVVDFLALENLQNLIIDNSLDSDSIRFEGLRNLQSLTLRNMMQLKSIGFDNMLNADDEPTLKVATLVNLPLIKNLTLNCTNGNHKIAFAPGSTLDLIGLSSLESISSNYSIKGLDKIILPSQTKTIEFTQMWGTGTCDITKVYSAESSGLHEIDKEECIDLKNLSIKKLRVPNLLKISKLKNLYYAPLVDSDRIDFQENRYGTAANPLLSVSGTCDITNYTGTFNNFFGGFDLDNSIELINNSDFMPQKALNYMFSNCTASEEVITNCLKPFKNVTNVDYMFYNANVTSINLNEFKGSAIISARSMFENCITLTNLTMDGLDLSSVVITDKMFYNCRVLPKIDISNCSIKKLSSCTNMFTYCNALNELNISNIGIVNKNCVTSILTSLSNSSSLQEISMDNWDFNDITDGSSILSGYQLGKNLSANGWIMNKVTTLANAFKSANFREIIASNWVVPRLKNTSAMFQYSTAGFISLSEWNTPELTDVSDMFYNCSSLTSLELSGWNMSKVTNFNSMFYSCSSLDFSSVGYDKWDISKGNDFGYMFYYCTLLEDDIKLPASTEYAAFTFYGCKGLLRINSNWNNTYTKTPNSSDCYFMCTKIEQIDGKLGTYVDDVPASWGGIDFSAEKTAIYEIDTSLGSRTDVGFTVGNGGIISWGDGTITLNENSSSTRLNHSYGKSGIYEVKIRNTRIYYNDTGIRLVTKIKQVASNSSSLRGCYANPDYSISSNYNYKDFNNCIEVDISNAANGDITSFRCAFAGFNKLTTIKGLDKIDTTKVTDMSYMFYNCDSLTDLSILSVLDTSNVTNMSGMFYYCSNLVSLSGAENWNTSSVTDMSYMFYYCNKLVSLSGAKNWNVSKVTNMSYMFCGCESLTHLNSMNNWKTDRLTNASYMFSSCDLLQDINGLTDWNVSTLANTSYMFLDCYSLSNLSGLSKWNSGSLNNVSGMFSGCKAIYDVTPLKFNTSNVINFADMFKGVPLTEKQIEEIVDNFDFSSADDLRIFGPRSSSTASILKPLFDKFENTRGLTSIRNLSYLFSGWNYLVDISILERLSVSPITNMRNMFYECKLLSDISPLSKLNVSSVTSMSYMFYSCDSLTNLSGVENWNTSSVTNMSYMFYGCDNLKDISALSEWNVSRLNYMDYMFYYCPIDSLTPLSKWDVSKVTDMDYAFYSCGNPSKPLTIDSTNIGNWNTVSLRYADHTFYYGYFGNITLNWNLKNVNMYYTFCAPLLKYLDLSACDANGAYYDYYYSSPGDLIGNNVETFKAPMNISDNLDLSNAAKLTTESLISVINNLSSVLYTTKLILGTTNINKLEPGYILMANRKGWEVS